MKSEAVRTDHMLAYLRPLPHKINGNNNLLTLIHGRKFTHHLYTYSDFSEQILFLFYRWKKLKFSEGKTCPKSVVQLTLQPTARVWPGCVHTHLQ